MTASSWSVFLLRHGDAEPNWLDDAVRELSPRGIRETQHMIEVNYSALSAVTTIYASPYVRAQQTAAIAAELLGLSVVTSSVLTPDAGIQGFQALLATLQDQTPLLVTHQPVVGNFIDWFGGLERGRYFMNTSSLACLQADVVSAGCADLIWMKHVDGMQ